MPDSLSFSWSEDIPQRQPLPCLGVPLLNRHSENLLIYSGDMNPEKQLLKSTVSISRTEVALSLNRHVEESYLLTKNSCTRLLGERDIILWDIKPLQPRGVIVIVANNT